MVGSGYVHGHSEGSKQEESFALNQLQKKMNASRDAVKMNSTVLNRSNA